MSTTVTTFNNLSADDIALHSLVAAIESLFPSAQNQVDYTIKVTAGVAELLTWNNVLGVQPTPAVIQAALVSIQLGAYKAIQSDAIQSSYQSEIDNGFTSSALGSSHLYPSTSADQANLTAVITASMIPTQPADWSTVFWCVPTATPSAWNYLSHTTTQIHQVGLDALSYIMGAKMRRAQLIGQIQAATTVAAVQAIVW